ncbi:D-alanyl-D-alanine carboxypeptidase/D-alanyl-D-alanine endopeptidase [Eisenibacter elegans]|jgi:D-alanyl-D-alanine carboxypeptidase/D-alanyl-D-alanine-endopeptidase (penicillin-binding protein 4)|uniref:D-alanyl-D-alanine carboxypeptidase/D-alanyl-D-alanine endopeptidase n=1 Tax=Eisenibacter elegans TaxID=997 RepID=UPI000416493D|nr:D-alanyl-D-alanine carboxypeptidase/D-alanyl-D-alanine-endopeptidase [Eisenibacter elegans]
MYKNYLANLFGLRFLPVLLLVGILLTCQSSENVAQAPMPYDPEQVQSALQTLVQDSVLRHGMLAVSVRSLRSQEVVVEHQGQLTLNAASVLKAVTTATALELLGSQFSFETTLAYDGRITTQGVLEGNLYLVGGGDPTFASPLMGQGLPLALAPFVQAVQRAGIRRIEGQIIADESLFDPNTLPYGWIWGDMGNYYGAPVHALNCLDNSYNLWLKPGATIGDPTEVVKTEPYLPGVVFHNRALTAAAGTGDNCVIYGAPYDQVRYTSGTIPQGGLFKVRGAIPDPGMLLISHLRERLKQQGVEVIGKNNSSRLLAQAGQNLPDTVRTVLYRHRSPALGQVAQVTNWYSVNLYAEAMLKALGREEKKQYGDTFAGAKAMKDYWQAQGLDVSGWVLHDGSGLSVSNGITTDLLTGILASMSQRKSYEVFYASLPVAGVSGTLAGMGGSSRIRGNLRAKSGAMTGVLAYAGYFTTATGEPMAFAIISNRHTCNYSTMRQKIETFLAAMVQ